MAAIYGRDGKKTRSGLMMAALIDMAYLSGQQISDLRAKALTDTEERDGMQAARRKGAHSTEQQTADYITHKRPQKAKTTR